MKVWVLLTGEQCEGGHVEGVFSSEEKAREAVSSIRAVFKNGWVEKEYNYWENGCDFVLVKEHELQ